MKRRLVYSALVMFFLCFLLLVPPVSPSKATPSLPPSQAQIENILQDQSSFFTENKGQWDPEILFMGDTSFGKVAFTKDAVYYQLIKVTETEESIDKEPQGKEEAIRLTAFPDRNLPHGIREENERIYESQVVKLSFVEGNIQGNIRGENPLSHYHNYFIGNDPKKWASCCKNYAKVYYEDIWEGIDLAYFFTEEGMKYEYYVEPGADIQKLQVRVEGAEVTTLGYTLDVCAPLGSISDKNLIVFDQGTKLPKVESFQVQGDCFSFSGIHDVRHSTLLIDPLVYSTYLGGSDHEDAHAIAVDASGNAYIVGGTWSSDFPTTPDAYQKTNKRGFNAFVTKLDPNGSTLLYSTYLGGSSADDARAIAVDASGNAYISGCTKSSDFPTTPDAYQKTNKEVVDFVTKLNSNGSALLYSTYLGGSGDDAFTDSSSGIALDEFGNAYIVGHTQSFDFPITSDAYQKTNKGSRDAFVTKLNSNGSALLYSTYLGGSDYDSAFGIAVDASGHAYITGGTWSSDFPITSDAYQKTNKGSRDAFVTKLNSNGSALLYSTYLGGSDYDSASGIAVDASGNKYIAGDSISFDFPITSDAYQKTNKGSRDAFVTKLNSNGSALLYSTYLGGSSDDSTSDVSGDDSASGIAVDASGNAYIAGNSNSSDFPTTPDAYQKIYKRFDVFVTKLNSKGSTLLYSTYLGGSSVDDALEITVDALGNTYIICATCSSDFPTTPDAYKKKSESFDAFVTKLYLRSNDTTPPEITIDYPPNNFITNTYSVILQGKVVDKESGIESLIINGIPQSFSSDGSFNCKIEFLQEGDNKFVITATNFASLSTTYELHVTRDTIPPVIASLELNGINLVRDKKKMDIPEIIWVKNSKPTIKGTIEESDSGIQEVILSVGGDIIKTELNSDGSFTVPLELQDNEPSEVKLIVMDKADNQSQEIKFQIGSDVSLPSLINLLIDNTTILNNQEKMEIPETIWVKSSKPTIKGTVEDGGSGIQEILCTKNNVPVLVYLADDNTFHIPLVLEKEIESEIKLTLTDKAGNSREYVLVVNVDSSNPEITLPKALYSPMLVYADQYTLLFEASDQLSGLSTVALSDQEGNTILLENRNARYQATLPLQKGGNLFTITAIDNAGNETKQSIQLRYQPAVVITLTIGNSVATVQKNKDIKEVVMKVPPMIIKGTTFVPIRFIAETFGAEVKWIPHPTNEIQIYFKDILIHLWIHKTFGVVERGIETKKVTLAASPFITNSTTMVPLRFISESLDAQVVWDAPTSTITIIQAVE